MLLLLLIDDLQIVGLYPFDLLDVPTLVYFKSEAVNTGDFEGFDSRLSL